MSYEFNENGERILRMPRMLLPTALGELALTWANTRLRVFNDAQFNHIEYNDGEHTLGLLVSPGLLDQLYEAEYPILSMPIVDDATFDWFIGATTKNMDREIDELLD